MSENRRSSDNNISTGTLVGWVVLALGVVTLGVLGYIGTNIASQTSNLPLIRANVEQQKDDLQGMKSTMADVPLIKLQMEYITKQLEHINSTQDASNRAIEDNRSKILNHESRIAALEATRKH